MSSRHPLEFFAPGWHNEVRTHVVDGKYYDRATGNVCFASDDDHQEWSGPPSVDIIVKSQHIDTVHCTTLAARSFPVEAILCHIMKVVGERKLELDSVIATPYATRVILSHELTPEKFG